MPLYHVTLANLFVGDVMLPGRHGSQYREYRPRGPMPTSSNIASLLWEIALESSRQANTPEKVSRLDCIFASERIQDAEAFREQYRTGGSIVILEPIHQNIPKHRADASLLQTGGRPYVDYMSEAATLYWTREPVGTVEVLIGGPAIVREVI